MSAPLEEGGSSVYCKSFHRSVLSLGLVWAFGFMMVHETLVTWARLLLIRNRMIMLWVF